MQTLDVSKINHNKIKNSKKFSIPKEKRVLKFNTANGDGADSMQKPGSTFNKTKVNTKFNMERRELKFPTTDIPSKW